MPRKSSERGDQYGPRGRGNKRNQKKGVFVMGSGLGDDTERQITRGLGSGSSSRGKQRAGSSPEGPSLTDVGFVYDLGGDEVEAVPMDGEEGEYLYDLVGTPAAGLGFNAAENTGANHAESHLSGFQHPAAEEPHGAMFFVHGGAAQAEKPTSKAEAEELQGSPAGQGSSAQSAQLDGTPREPGACAGNARAMAMAQKLLDSGLEDANLLRTALKEILGMLTASTRHLHLYQ
ncbi:hypothetical protein CYMTET_40539, partial [Cymbomonas tetramitiformis]